MITRALKGLEDVISVSVVHPTWQKTRPDDEADAHCGWVFRDESDPPMQSPAGYGSFPCAGCVPDDVCGATTVREIYDKVGYDGKKFTVPILFDKKTMKIVNNESSEIIRMLNAAFNEFCDEKAVPGARDRDLYPAELRGARATARCASAAPRGTVAARYAAPVVALPGPWVGPEAAGATKPKLSRTWPWAGRLPLGGDGEAWREPPREPFRDAFALALAR